MPDCPVKREVCSWILFSLSSKLSYHLLPHSFIFILIYNLPGTVDCHSLTPQRIIEGASRGYTVRENSLGELLVQDSLMSHRGLDSQALGTRPRRDQESQFKPRERVKRITGNCISKGPSKNALKKRKKKLKRKTIVSWKHRNKSSKGEWSGSEFKRKERKSQKDDGKLDRKLIRKGYLRKTPPRVISVWSTMKSGGNAVHSFALRTCNTTSEAQTKCYKRTSDLSKVSLSSGQSSCILFLFFKFNNIYRAQKMESKMWFPVAHLATFTQYCTCYAFIETDTWKSYTAVAVFGHLLHCCRQLALYGMLIC